MGELLGIAVDDVEGSLVGIADGVAVVALVVFFVWKFISSLVGILNGDDVGAVV